MKIKRRAARVATQTLPLFASAMRRQKTDADLARIEGRASHVSTGITSVDTALGGGFLVGALTLAIGRPRMGVSSLFVEAALHNSKKHIPISYFTERLTDEQLRGRLVVRESEVNGFRFKAGFVSASDRVALNLARERIAWNALHLVTHRGIFPAEIDEHIFSYRPHLVLLDVMPKAPQAQQRRSASSFLEGVGRLASLTRRHRVAMVLRYRLPKAAKLPALEDVPQLDALKEHLGQAVALHRQGVSEEDDTQGVGKASLMVFDPRGSHTIPTASVPLHFDARFAALTET